MNEGAFELPDGAVTDKTIHMVEVQRGAHRLTLVCLRYGLPEGKSLLDVSQARVREDMKRLEGYALLESGESSLAGAPALAYSARWRQDDAALYQRQAHVALERAWIALAVSAPWEGRHEVDAWFAQIHGTMRLRPA